MSTPSARFPEITLRSAEVVPPMMLSVEKVTKMPRMLGAGETVCV